MNSFGSNWTSQKINIVELYAKAYLHIMKENPYWKLLYFDGFAGSGDVEIEYRSELSTIEGAAKRIIAIDDPKRFDMYYFVELNKQKAERLKLALKVDTRKDVYVVSNDCNEKLKSLADYLRSSEGKRYKVLAFIDPFGMNLNFSSIEYLKELGVDMWLLIPTGIGANRLLKRDGAIPEAWLLKLESFFGINRELVLNGFYRHQEYTDLFGNSVVNTRKTGNSIRKVRELYVSKLKEVFRFVSNSYEMRNSSNSVMFDFVLASNNATAVKIANDIVKRANSGMYGTK